MAELLSTDEVAALAGVSYVTVHRWHKAGILRPTVAPAGSGTRAGYTRAEAAAAVALGRVTRLGFYRREVLERIVEDVIARDGEVAGTWVAIFADHAAVVASASLAALLVVRGWPDAVIALSEPPQDDEVVGAGADGTDEDEVASGEVDA